MTSTTTSPGTDEHPMMGSGRGRLAGKVAVITGANSGIGRAAARLFAREGSEGGLRGPRGGHRAPH